MEYSQKYISEFLRDIDPFSILVIYGRRLYSVKCPFRVRLLVDVIGFKEGDVKWVEKVLVTRELKMVYMIGGNGYHFYLFQILLP